jgi:hypothetical protein
VGTIEGSTAKPVVPCGTVAVEQRERRVRAEPAQVDGRAVGDVAGAAGLSARILGNAEIENLRQPLDERRRRERRLEVDVLARNFGDGRADYRRPADAAAGDDDLIEIDGLLRRRILRERGC